MGMTIRLIWLSVSCFILGFYFGKGGRRWGNLIRVGYIRQDIQEKINALRGDTK